MGISLERERSLRSFVRDCVTKRAAYVSSAVGKAEICPATCRSLEISVYTVSSVIDLHIPYKLFHAAFFALCHG